MMTDTATKFIKDDKSMIEYNNNNRENKITKKQHRAIHHGV